MTYSLDFETRDNILWVTATGTRSIKAVLEISKEVMDASKEQGIKKVLVDIRPLEGRLSTSSSFLVPAHFFPKIRDPKILSQVALLDLEDFEYSNQFFENAAVKRGLNLKFFSDELSALTWLRK